MHIEFKCPCGTKLRVPSEHAGKKTKCPSCQTLNVIPIQTVQPIAPKPIQVQPIPVKPIQAQPKPASAKQATASAKPTSTNKTNQPASPQIDSSLFSPQPIQFDQGTPTYGNPAYANTARKRKPMQQKTFVRLLATFLFGGAAVIILGCGGFAWFLIRSKLGTDTSRQNIVTAVTNKAVFGNGGVLQEAACIGEITILSKLQKRV
jgi:hypothetical protein